MEPHQMNEVDGGGKPGFLCRQSSTRWTPTTDQIRILKDLYYKNGVRSPSAEQIQRISARLRQYGKIEGKNVFYWFQNHKARERQKKRFTADHHHLSTPMHQSSLLNPVFTTNPSGPSPSTGVYTIGKGCSYAYGSHPHPMDKQSFIRDSSLLGAGGGGGQNYGWVGNYVDPYSSSSSRGFFDKTKLLMEEEASHNDDEEDNQLEDAAEIETLPLFPTYVEDIKMNCSGGGWYRSSSFGNGGSRSLELSLNSSSATTENYRIA